MRVAWIINIVPLGSSQKGGSDKLLRNPNTTYWLTEKLRKRPVSYKDPTTRGKI